MGEVITTAISTKQLGDDGIVRIVMLPDADMTQANVEADMATYSQAFAGQRRPVWADIRHVKSMSREARVFITREARKYVMAAALVVESPLSRMIGNFFLGFNKPPFPVRLFTSGEKAEEWLQQFVKGSSSE